MPRPLWLHTMTGGGSGGDNLMLFQCARIGDADGLVALLDQGASPNWRNPVATGWTAVHAAVDGASDAGGDPLRAAHVLRVGGGAGNSGQKR